jgi:hypothetical protein
MKMSSARLQKVLILFASLSFEIAASTAAGGSPSQSISAAKLKEHVYFLASEDLEGRYPGSRGFRIAVEYAANRFRAAGLLPASKLLTAGEFPPVEGLIADIADAEYPTGTGSPPAAGPSYEQGYLHPVPLCYRAIKEAAVVTLQTPAGERVFSGGRDLKIYLSENLCEEGDPLPVVFAGFGIHEPAAGWDGLEGLDVAGKVVVFLMGAPTMIGRPVLPEPLHGLYAPMNSFIRKALAMRGAAAVLVPAGADLLLAFEEFPAFPERPQFVLPDSGEGTFRCAPICFISPELCGAILGNKGLPSPEDVAEGRVLPGEIEGVSLGISVPFIDEEVLAWNVMGLVEGADPVLKNEIVAVSAHLGHLHPNPDGRIHPGANGNASGAAALLEIAEAIARHPVKRSILLILTGAEEGGMMGMRSFLSNCSASQVKIVADVNIDMLERTEPGHRGYRARYICDSGKSKTDEGRKAEGVRYVVNPTRTTPAFTGLIKEVNSRTVDWPLIFDRPSNLGDSDHRAFETLGIPAANFYAGRIPDTHETTDTPDKLDYEKIEKIARLVCEIALELGDREQLWR